MIQEHVLLFSNPTWSNGHSVPSTIIRNITALSSQLAYSESILGNITTISTNYVPTTDGTIQGLLYVPDLPSDDSCYELANRYIPANATRQADLPPTDYILIALAPWINVNCTKSFMAAAALDPLRAMLVYRPDDDNGQPPEAKSALWELNDGGAWELSSHFPVYAVSPASGRRMMKQLSLYSGDLSQVPFASQINQTYSPNPSDYVRVWTQLSVSPEPSSLAIWAFVLIILGVLLAVIGSISLLMHYVQNRRRAFLRRRVMNGEVNLEALGIKRLTVPLRHIQTFPLFTYNYDPPPILSSPTSPNSVRSPCRTSFDSGPLSSSHNRGTHGDRLDYQPACQICLGEFQSKVTIIRELSCGHIFHPECIDQFLSEMSSLCPLCKASMYPRGHCPKITNTMVRRELGTRKLRRGALLTGFGGGGFRQLLTRSGPENNRTRRASVSPEVGTSIQLQKQPSPRRNSAADMTRERMQELVTPIDETNSDDGRPRSCCINPIPWILLTTNRLRMCICLGINAAASFSRRKSKIVNQYGQAGNAYIITHGPPLNEQQSDAKLEDRRKLHSQAVAIEKSHSGEDRFAGYLACGQWQKTLSDDCAQREDGDEAHRVSEWEDAV
ncbi:hypothetical protein HD806DRAFT_523006 [Xylariaceae sp. AK1471]|nr:hypothetical protein HD806DRAFT_523006 [Xylariaceae sp. AK1471]